MGQKNVNQGGSMHSPRIRKRDAHLRHDSGNKTALVHFVAEAMLKDELHAYQLTIPRLKFFIDVSSKQFKANPRYHTDSSTFKAKHWLLGPLKDCKQEFVWLKYQAERSGGP